LYDFLYFHKQSSNTKLGAMIAMGGYWKRFPLVVLTSTLGLIGCSRNADRTLNAGEERLLTISNAYLRAADKLGRAPKGFEEIKPYLDGKDSEEILVSPNDGENFVIIWGVDYHRLPPPKENPFTVGGYEKTGKGGKRYVLRYPRSVVLMTDEELRKAAFPPGHKPPA
jgi:hypothetical protein